MQLSDIDLLDRDAFLDGPPHEWFTFLRNNAPLHRHPETDGPGFWVITKYDHVVAVNRNAKTFSSDQRRGGVVGLEELPDTERDNPFARDDAPSLMLTMDPPAHTR